MSLRLLLISAASAAAAAVLLLAAAQAHHPGFTDTPYLPGQKWRVHDSERPYPRLVTPGEPASRPPSDAVVLFDGKDLSHWVNYRGGKAAEPTWKLGPGYVEMVKGSGDLVSKEKFGDAQIHLEWATPAVVEGADQLRGNSGVLIMHRYEIQILDSWKNPTYADGCAGAIYGQWPPLVSAPRAPGEWQSYDIAFEAPRFEDGKLVKPACVTVFHNGVLVHHHQQIVGEVAYRKVAHYTPHAAEEPLALQDHDYPVRFRNIWVRRLTGYDQP